MMAAVAPDPNDVVRAATEDMTQRFTDELGEFVKARIKADLSDAQFAVASSALMIALNRQLAGTAAAFGETHGIPAEQVQALVFGQFRKNHRIALEACKQGVTIN